MLNEIIEKYCSNALFIDVDNVDIKNYLSKLSIADRNMLLKDIYYYNNKRYKELKKQNKEYLKVLNSDKVDINSPISKIKKVKNKLSLEEKENATLKIDISFYINCIEQVSNLDELQEFLPDKSNSDYIDIINAILIKLLEERIIIQRLIKDTDKNDPDILYYQEELDKVVNKINYIKNYNSRIVFSKEEVIKKENHVIFLTTNMDNNCFMNDLLKNVDEHHYVYVKELLKSIKDGTFKNVKAFTENNSLTGVFEVKLSQLRVLFRRLKPGIYVVTQVLVKKFQTGHHYHSTMISRNSLYNNQEQTLLSKSKDKEFLNYNQEVYNGIINYLDISKKGGNNGKINQKNK